jgi:hypothetical protein
MIINIIMNIFAEMMLNSAVSDCTAGSDDIIGV